MEAAILIAFRLILALIGFVAIAYVGRFYDRRVAGVLLTFPLLNAIALLTAPDPQIVAGFIYGVVIWNGVLFLLISRTSARPEASEFYLLVRLAAWSVLWFIVAAGISLGLADVVGAHRLPWLFVLSVAVACACIVFWQPAGATASAAPRQRGFLRQLRSLFAQPAFLGRLALFVAAFCLLTFVAWKYPGTWIVGVFAAFPLPGIFAIASLSNTLPARYLRDIGDNAPLGAPLVIVFNAAFALVVPDLPRYGMPALLYGGLACLVGWGLYAVICFAAIPQIVSAITQRRKQA